MNTTPHQSILIIDFGSQVTQLIARRVRETGVYCEIHPFQSAAKGLREDAAEGVIFSGGPASVLDENSPRAPQAVFDSGVPILAICYGQQTLCLQLGGEVEGGHAREFGRADVEIKKASPLFEGLWEVGNSYPVWMSHGDRVTKLAAGFEIIAPRERALRHRRRRGARKYYTTMFHPEVVHTPDGGKLLANFVTRSSAQGRLDDGRLPPGACHRQDPRAGRQGQGDLRPVGRRRFSSVAAVLIHEAIGDQLTCVFVDHG
jgi:GMP synthase (glutamine-hydrolysing)